MKNSMLLIFLAIGGVIAYFVLGKKQQPGSQGTNTILGSSGSAQPMVTQSKAAKQRTDNTAAYIQAGAGLLSSLIGNKSGFGAGVKYTGDLPFLPGNWLSRKPTNDPKAPGNPADIIYAGNGSVVAKSDQYDVSAGPLYTNPGQYSEPIGPDLSSFDSPDAAYIGSIYTDTSGPQTNDSNPYSDYTGD